MILLAASIALADPATDEKAQVIAAQEAYQQHVESAEKKEGAAWLFDAPSTLLKVNKKAMKELRKSMPFGKDNDDKED